MTTEVTTRKWGNSLGVILPKELVEKENLKENQKVIINLVKEADLSKLCGSLKLNVEAQTFKNSVRKNWSRHS